MRSWYEFKAKAGAKETEVLLYDEIGGFGISAAQFIAELQTVPPENRLVLRIHCGGGSVFDGNAIANAVRQHPGGVTTQVDGLAASMATVISIVGSPARIAGNGWLMIHNVSGGANGDAEDLRRSADLMDRVQEGIVDAYAKRTGMTRKEIRDMMDEETWMNAKQAKKLGFVDEITDDVTVTAKFDLSRFRNAPLDIAAFSCSQPTIISTNTPSMLIETPEYLALKAEHEAAKTRFQNLDADFKSVSKDKLDLTAALEAKGTEITELTGKLEASGKKVIGLEAAAVTAKTTFDAALAKKDSDCATAISEFDKKVDLAASNKVGSLGYQPPVNLGPEGESPTVDDIEARLEKITDPVERAHFRKKNFKAIQEASDRARAKAATH